MERTTATSVPKVCCPRLRLDKVLRNEDIELLLVLVAVNYKEIGVAVELNVYFNLMFNKFTKQEHSLIFFPHLKSLVFSSR